MSSDDENMGGDLFREPEDYFQPEKPASYAQHTLNSGQVLNLRLVGHNPLWGHLLWNAGRTITTFLEDRKDIVRDKTILELGAGAGLPSLACALFGARRVVVTDYPDPDLVDNLRKNIGNCDGLPSTASIVAEGYVWGASTDPLLKYLPEGDSGFDLLILADLLFNHSEHQKLASTICSTLNDSHEAQALVFFTPYRPWLYEKDLAFFKVAEAQGLHSEKILEHVMDKVMFEEDPGDESLRRTVFGYKVTRKGSR